MHYLVLLYSDETGAAEPGTPEFDAELAGYEAFGELAGPSIRGGAALHLTETARTIRHDGGTVTVTDGPFAETTEALGGYYVLEADSLDDVIEMVRHIPATSDPTGASEIRPLVMVESSITDESDLRGAWLATMHGPETGSDVPDTPEWEQAAAAHGAFAQAAGDAILEGGALHPTAAATTVRVRGGDVQVTDGPFAEAIEVVGGYYVLRGSADEVLAIAEKIPVNEGGAVELRPVMDLSGAEG